jgi:hypothetical protein
MRPTRRVLLALAVVAILVPGLVYPYFEDTALFAAVAKLALRGLRLYRDLEEQKTPGILFMEMARLSLLGASSLAARASELVSLTLAALVVADLGRAAGLGGRAQALLALALAALSSSAIWGLPERGQVEFHQIVFIVAALVAAARAAEDRSRALAWAAGSGAAIAWACWLKPQAALLGVAIFVALAIAPAAAARVRLRRLAVFVTGGVGISLLCAARLVLAGEWDAFLDVMFRFNPAYLSISHVPLAVRFHAGANLLFGTPRAAAVTALALAGTIALFLRVRRGQTPPHLALLCAAPLPWGMLTYVTGGYAFLYHAIASVAGLAILAAIGADALLAFVPRPALRGALATAVLLALTVNGAWLRDAGDLVSWTTGAVATGDLYARRGVESYYYSYDAEEEAARVVDRLTPEGERFFVFGRAGATYLLAHRLPASRHLITSVAWIREFRFAAEVHDELVRELSAHPPAVILLSGNDVFRWFGQDEPSAVLVLQDPVLGPWLRAHYDVSGRIGRNYAVARRKPAATPPPAPPPPSPAP